MIPAIARLWAKDRGRFAGVAVMLIVTAVVVVVARVHPAAAPNHPTTYQSAPTTTTHTAPTSTSATSTPPKATVGAAVHVARSWAILWLRSRVDPMQLTRTAPISTPKMAQITALTRTDQIPDTKIRRITTGDVTNTYAAVVVWFTNGDRAMFTVTDTLDGPLLVSAMTYQPNR